MPNWIPIVTKVDRNKVQGWVAKAPPGTLIAFKKQETRSIEQNRMLWPLLTIISNAIPWDGKMRDEYQWKDLFTAALRGCDVVQGINPGTVVALGLHTSTLSVSEFSALIEIIYSFAAERGISLDKEENPNDCAA